MKSYLNRTGFSKADLCRKLGLDAKSSLLSSYEKGRSDPSYDMCVKLLQLGMTVEELFGKECADRLLQNSVGLPLQLPPEIANDPDFQKGLQQSIDAKVSAAVKAELAALKSKGLL